MRLVVDLQACETDSRDRGIGRYAMSLVQAIASELGETDELVIAIDMADTDRARDVRIELHRRNVRAKVVAYGYPTTRHSDASPAVRKLAGQMRARFFASLHPDVLLFSTFFETGTAYCMGLDWAALTGIATAAIGYDVIPMRFQDRYLACGDFFSRWYPLRLQEFRNFDLILAISESTRHDFIAFAELDGGRMAVIDGGFDEKLVADHDTDAARRRLRELGVEQPFVLTVGNGDWRKNTVGSLDAFASLPKGLRETHQLVLTQVGQYVDEALAGKHAHLRDRVKILGRVDDATLALLYRECKIFYFPSYFEGFGLPVLEAMAFDAPVLSSRAGALPEVIHDPRALFDPNEPGEGVALLVRALEDERFREGLRRGARQHALTFTWKRTARKALEALRVLVGERGRRFGATDTARPPWPEQRDIALMADACIEAGERGDRALENGLRAVGRAGKRRVLVDITEVMRLDAKTGIQRVTRNFFTGLFAVARESRCLDVEPLCWTEQGIVYARSYARDHMNVPCEGSDGLVRVEPSDILFMLDSSWWSPERFDEFHACVHEAGGEVVWMVHDLGPVRYPETCNPAVLPVFQDWITHAVHTTDGFICNSEATRCDLESFMDHLGRPGMRRPWTRVVHLGCDLDSSIRSGPSVQGEHLRARLGTTPYFMALGTLEPRKDHKTIIDAFDLLWRRGVDATLVIVGGQGWNVEQLIERIVHHVEQGKRLIWLQDVTDGDVRYLLEGAAALIQASIWEGFGLPLVEAGSLGVPLLVSDIPVFHEVADDGATYFPVGNATALADSVVDILDVKGIRDSTITRRQTWQDSSLDLVDALGGVSLAAMDDSEAYGRALQDRPHVINAAGMRRVLVDITEIARSDAKTGIQRVTRNFFAGLAAVARDSGSFKVEPFCWTEQGIRYARRYGRDRLGALCDGPDDLVMVEPSDLVFMLDSSWFPPERFDALHERAHASGGKVVWMVYDLIPIRFPETCDPGMPPAFTSWLTHAVRTADGFVCISEATRNDLEAFMDEVVATDARRPWTRSVHLGCDLDPTAGSRPSEKGAALQAALGERPYFTALGTLEPRKDYETVINAFELLWSRGVDAALVIIGKQGWHVDALVERIDRHPERNRRLFWLQGASDGDVRNLLEGAAGLIQASIWEGYGLPLIEAGSLGVPLLASDIAVFHEIAGDSAIYFPVGDVAALAQAVASMLGVGQDREMKAIRVHDWGQASETLARILELL